MKLTKRIADFLKSEKIAGVILIFCAALSLSLANSSIHTAYIGIWKFTVAGNSLDHWINDGLMAIFFLLIGLELKTEIQRGELSTLKSAMFPLCAALGGMLVPAGIYFFLTYGTPAQAGTGIPMATDIVFALGILSLFGKRVPVSLKIFLTALAVIDDLGAILTIAIFYTKQISFLNLSIALALFGLLVILNRLKLRNGIPYLAGGIAMWYFMLHSGVHATIAGVLLAFVIPSSKEGHTSASDRLKHFLHNPVTFLILPVFALANTAIHIQGSGFANLVTPNGQGIFFGLLLGKPIGILLLSFLAVSLRICTKPQNIKWSHISGVGLLGGIGFTMSIFITLLAFDTSAEIDGSKIAIIITSAIAAMAGIIFLRFALPGAVLQAGEER